MTMTDDQYKATQNAVVEMCKDVLMLDLVGFLNCIEHTEATAHLMDPTLWLKGNARLEAIKRCAVAFRGAQGAAEELRLLVLGEIAAGKDVFGTLEPFQ
jgi:hypothetical protein